MNDPLSYVLCAFEQPFRDLGAELANRYPEARFSVRNVPVGSGVHLAHVLYLVCFWPSRGPDDPDNVVLEVNLCHLTTVPRINADICWGEGQIEVEFFSNWSRNDDWPEATPELLEQLSAQMPFLMAEFRRVVDRGWPVKSGQP